MSTQNSNVRTQVNSVTGAREIQMPATFKGWVTDPVGDIMQRENSNGTVYQMARVEVVNQNTGEITRPVALVYEGNFNHPEANFEEGEQYLCTISEGTDADDDSVYFRLSHLKSAQRVTKAQFGFDSLFGEGETSEGQAVSEAVEETQGVNLDEAF